ncbi:hypothetical protein CDAR_372631 [Caerostris darwini]|uniref:Uncharacterized protein n=1 Tax=Caerostris darwini TaxID=1538125 RepID=A0AAV4TB30_9ARAC|nr:hypothetical protein CDAR_372631 [Caerostris darwini]
MVSSDEKRNPNDISRKEDTWKEEKKRIRSRILRHEGVSQTDLLRTLNVIPRVRPSSRGQAKRRTDPKLNSLPNQEERSRRPRRKERWEEEKKKKRKKKRKREETEPERGSNHSSKEWSFIAQLGRGH